MVLVYWSVSIFHHQCSTDSPGDLSFCTSTCTHQHAFLTFLRRNHITSKENQSSLTQIMNIWRLLHVTPQNRSVHVEIALVLLTAVDEPVTAPAALYLAVGQAEGSCSFPPSLQRPSRCSLQLSVSLPWSWTSAHDLLITGICIQYWWVYANNNCANDLVWPTVWQNVTLQWYETEKLHHIWQGRPRNVVSLIIKRFCI